MKPRQDTSPILLIPRPAEDWAVHHDLPELRRNLFQRIIRNLHADSDNPRERPCTEMFASLLLLSPTARLHILKWMGELVGCARPFWADESVTCDIRTEQPVGAKRDDLRIEAWRSSEEGEERVALWSVEVKVGASIHTSSEQTYGDETDDEDGLDDVSQIVNYDNWLQAEAEATPTAHIAGFVLARKNLSKELPRTLKQHWTCTSWTSLGEVLLKCLEDKNLADDEALLIKHTLGFIRKHLWREEEVKESELALGFDDIALLKAFPVVARTCEQTVDRFVAALLPVFEQALEETGGRHHQKALFKPTQRSVVYARVFQAHPYPQIFAGIDMDVASVSVWVESSPKHDYTKLIRETVSNHLSELKSMDARWKKGGEDGWRHVSISLPLEALLAEEDQGEAICRFVSQALEQLKQSGFLGGLKVRLDGEFPPES